VRLKAWGLKTVPGWSVVSRCHPEEPEPEPVTVIGVVIIVDERKIHVL